jgi:general stress protein 26
MEEKTGAAARKDVQKLIKDIRIAMLATRGGDGRFHARPMATADTEFDGTLWFLTDKRTLKVDELAADPEVLVTYASASDESYVSIAGRATLVGDKATLERLWSEPARAWFPDGLKDPNIVAMKVDVEIAEYWDSPSGSLVMAYGYLKAVTTGKRASDYPGAEHGIIRN